MVSRFFSALHAMVFLIPATSAIAQEGASGIIDSIAFGISAHEIASDEENGVDGTVELRLRSVSGQSWPVEILPTVGAALNFGGDTNSAYLGATARYRLTESVFIEGFFGFAIHDADTPTDADGLDLGCDVLFREGLGIGYQQDHHAISLHVSHASHGGILCDADENDGLTSTGMRYSYQF